MFPPTEKLIIITCILFLHLPNNPLDTLSKPLQAVPSWKLCWKHTLCSISIPDSLKLPVPPLVCLGDFLSPAGDALDLAITNWSISQPINTTNLSITNKIFRLGHNIHLQIGRVGLETKYLGITGEYFLGLGRPWVQSLLHNQQTYFHSACDWPLSQKRSS